MQSSNLPWVLLILSLTVNGSSSARKPIICYCENWWTWRASPLSFNLASLDNNHCSHIIYSFVTIDYTDYKPETPGTAEAKVLQGLLDFRSTKDPDVKIMIAVGGASYTQTSRLATMATNPTHLSNFVQGVMDFVKQYDLDGVDIDWEFPTNNAQKTAYTTLMQNLRSEFDTYGAVQGNRKLTLSMAVSAYEPNIDLGWEVPAISNYVDFINVMAYDLSGSWFNYAGHHSSFDNNPKDSRLTVVHAMDTWVDRGAPKEKLVVGIPTYARSLKLTDPNNNGFGATTFQNTPGTGGYYLNDPGYLAYFEVCRFTDNDPTNVVYPNTQGVPYYASGNDWLGYESPASAAEKAKYILDNDFGGAMFWSMGMDDYNMLCDSTTRRYPIISAVNDVFVAAEGGSTTTTPTSTSTPTSSTTTPSSTTPTTPSKTTPATTTPATTPATTTTSKTTPATTTPATTTTSTSTTTYSGSEFSCEGKSDGMYAYPNTCTGFHTCVNGIKYDTECPTGLLFNEANGACDWAYNVSCD